MWDVFLPLLYGAAGYLVATVLHTVLTRGSVPRAHERYRDRVLELLHRRVNLEAELADTDVELAECWAGAPSRQARLIVRTVERARTMPRRMRQLAARFGFDVPDVVEEVPRVVEEAQRRQGTQQHSLVSPQAVAPAPASLPPPSAWSTPPPRMRSNGHSASS